MMEGERYSPPNVFANKIPLSPSCLSAIISIRKEEEKTRANCP